MLAELRRLFAHITWADERLLQALTAAGASAEALREFAHTLGADETWLARLEQRPPRTGVWPALTVAELQALVTAVHEGFRRYLVNLDDSALGRIVGYTNSAGKFFETPVRDILIHVALHAQYHRGKVNLLLRQAGLEPAATDFIAFVRGAPAATTEVGIPRAAS